MYLHLQIDNFKLYKFRMNLKNSLGKNVLTPQILIVEDEVITRNTLKKYFWAEGYNVFEAGDSTQCIKLFLHKKVDLVIMDINLPGKNGLMLARELRENTDTPLMFLTGRDNEVDEILGLEIGAMIILLSHLTHVS